MRYLYPPSAVVIEGLSEVPAVNAVVTPMIMMDGILVDG